MEEKFGPLEKKDKKMTDINRQEIFQRTSQVQPFRTRKNNEEILEELKVETADEKLRRYKSNRPRHVSRMNSSRVAKIMLNYRPN
jgi:hypothetical protein